MENHYFDERGAYIGSAPAGGEEFPPRNALRAEPPRLDGLWPVLNATRDGWDLVEDNRGREGYIGGEPAAVAELGPLPDGWSDTRPDSPPTEEEERMLSRARADAILSPLLMKAVAETAELTDAELVTVGAAGYFDEWTAGEVYAAGERLVHDGIVYVVEQAVVAQEHQPPDSAGMLAVYRPVRPAGEDEPDGSIDHPFDLIVGMAGEVGTFYRHAGEVWECLRAMANILESWLPGSPGMESFWRKVEATPAPLMAASAPGVAETSTVAPAVDVFAATETMAIVPPGSSVPEVAEAMTLGTTVPTRYLLNTTKTTYHDLYCPDAVSGSLRTLAQIAELTEGQAKPCARCAPPALA